MRAYSFHSSWWVPHAPERVRGVLVDVERYPEWWPQVLGCLKTGPDDGVVLCRSSLPYTLELHLHAEERESRVLETSISGDLTGWVRWSLAEDGAGCRLAFDQEVVVNGAILGFASFVARPALRWNHARMIAGARSGLAHRLAG